MCESEVTQSCLIPSGPMDYSLPGSSIHGIFQARVLEWVAIAFSVYNLYVIKFAGSWYISVVSLNDNPVFSDVCRQDN